MYKTLVTVMNEVVEDMENNYQPHSLAFKWQNHLSEKLQEYLRVDSDIPPPPAPENTVTNPPMQGKNYVILQRNNCQYPILIQMKKYN